VGTLLDTKRKNRFLATLGMTNLVKEERRFFGYPSAALGASAKRGEL
jgi:hypothetical protein